MNTKIKQIIYDMHTQPVIAWVTVIGTTLSVFLIMTVVMMQQVKILSFKPESHRDRMLYGLYIHLTYIENEDNSSSGQMSYQTAKRLYDGLDGVEHVSFMHDQPETVDAKGTTNEKFSVDMRETDDAFWRVFDHELLEGRYYNADEVASQRHVAVISDKVARRLFGGENAVGNHFELDHNDYEVIGIVASTSKLATWAYGEVFAPINMGRGNDDMYFGYTSAAMLLKPDTDKEDIRRQVKARYAEFDTELAASGLKTVYHEAPFDQETIAGGARGSNTTPDNSSQRNIRFGIYAILLIVPAINLSNMLHSRLRRRINELGIRRAFGCTRSKIMSDIITENFIVTVFGGIIGLALSIVFALFYDGLYTDSNGVAGHPSLSLLLNWQIIITALGVCFLLNLISAAVPAWHASRVKPVEAINAK